MNSDLLRELAASLGNGRLRIFDLSQEWRIGMPHWPTHPPFLYSLSKGHGDIVLEGGVSSAAEVMTLGGHLGTHIDALGHFSRHGRLHGGIAAAANQSFEYGLAAAGIDRVLPIVRRGVLLDVVPDGMDALAPSQAVMAADLEAAATRAAVPVEPGDVALIRTGWGRLWDRPREMAGPGGAPGLDLGAAQWLSARRIFAAGSDTLAFEVTPTSTFPVHVHLLVESGIHIMEALDLEAVRQAAVYEFLFVASPLKIRGGTGSPIRPFAIA